jgi:oligoendopeptidase F
MSAFPSISPFAVEPQSAAAEPAPPEAPVWDLDDLYPGPDAPALKRDLAWLEAEIGTFQNTYAEKLDGLLHSDDGPTALFEAIENFEAMSDRLGRVMSYAGLRHAANTTDPEIAKFFGDMQTRANALSTGLLFFPLELNKLDEKALAEAAASAPLDHYKPWLDDLALERPYQLDETTERLFHEKSVTGAAAWNRLFDQTMAGLTFRIGTEDQGLEQTLNLLLDKDGAKRKAAAQALAETFSANLRLFAHITNTLAKDKEISDSWRGFGDVAAARHLANRVESDTVDALVEAVRAAYPRLSHRYYRLKAEFMSLDKLNHWDRNAPLPFEDDRLIGWDQARGVVLDAYRGFDPEMAKIADRFFASNWIDAALRPGKSPGAFSHPTVPSAHPFILMNFQGRTRDVMTLAHELGHGVHQVLAAPQGALMASTPLTLAETASVFGEMLTFRALLDSAEDRQARRSLIANKIEDMLNTVVRQIAFYLFERSVHEARREGELTADDLGALWLKVQGESLGEAVELGPGYETFWCYVPHFIHAPFYVYAYAFGDCLVNSLFAVYQKAETGFAENYFNLLKAGGSRPYGELLKPFGLDARDPAFWNIGLDMISDLIDELEAMSET